ncbi:uncharacterized protein LOC135500565 isoform X3 [Lineus longissimus]|uniref:uncharacterized protein LOC135500565 isoform X3 n=1 Tax=Lineus longissimus TaxID=88925 RepID=UPI00315D658B
MWILQKKIVNISQKEQQYRCEPYLRGKLAVAICWLFIRKVASSRTVTFPDGINELSAAGNSALERNVTKGQPEIYKMLHGGASMVCVICLGAKATMQTQPCGHRVVCRKCFVKTIQVAVSQRCLPLRCVICRTRILKLKQQSSTSNHIPLISSFLNRQTNRVHPK